MSKLIPNRKLEYAIEVPMTKAEARKDALKTFKTFGSIVQTSFAALLIGLLSIPVIIAAEWAALVPLVGIFLFLLYIQYDNYYSFNRNRILYKDIKETRDQLDDFLKEKGYLDT
ncbi:MAG: hypothetical protein M0R77_18505 [Gammaproteobacteria bacterium]|nr:hypothetical protein [Gammaproteobacteria bacterium]